MTLPVEFFGIKVVRPLTEVDALIDQLHRALVLTKADAEKNGFTYGPQSVCQQALKAYQKWAKP